MRKFEVAAKFTTGWIEIEIDDDFIEECDENGIDIEDDTAVVEEYLKCNQDEFLTYLELEDFEFDEEE